MQRSRGQDPEAGRHPLVLPCNDLALVEQRLAARDVVSRSDGADDVQLGRHLTLTPYLEWVRDSCKKCGTLLIFDEVVTGFRVASGGAQQRFGVIPDIATFGKAICKWLSGPRACRPR